MRKWELNEEIDRLSAELSNLKFEFDQMEVRAENAERKIELLELYIGLQAIEVDQLLGLSISHGFRGWPDHLELGNTIRKELGAGDANEWTRGLINRARKRLGGSP